MSVVEKEQVAANLRAIMAKLKLSPEELADKANISRYQVDNILYCRALRPATLKKIADALDLKVEQLMGQNSDTYTSTDFDIKAYSQIMLSIQKTLERYNLKSSKFLIDRVANIIYKNFSEIINLDEAVKGIIFFLKDNDPDLKSSDA